MSKQQQLLKQELSVSRILRTYGKQFKQIAERYSDGHNGRYVIGVLMSYCGWDGKDDSQAAKKLLGALIALRYAGIDRNLLIEMNVSFDEIADYLDKIGSNREW
jgi:hypothetical protein